MIFSSFRVLLWFGLLIWVRAQCLLIKRINTAAHFASTKPHLLSTYLMHIPLLTSILGQFAQHILFKRFLNKVAVWKFLVGSRCDIQCSFHNCQVGNQLEEVCAERWINFKNHF